MPKRLRAYNQIRTNIFNCQALTSTKIKEINFVQTRVKTINRCDTIFFMRTYIYSVANTLITRIKSGSYLALPRHDSTHILPQMLVTNRSKITLT
ncbi:MAG: hypothetical protein CL859_04065 [Cyanobium sp. ARS6]|nr:hypothetical protein [Cyanobium sp. ARS6]